jgi:hypothetical protein
LILFFCSTIINPIRMKTISKILSAAILLICAQNSFAQATGTATATATIVTPISIQRNTHMNFGNVAVQASTAGTVTISPAGVRSRTAGVTLPNVAGTVTAATFTVSGTASYTYTITLPTSVTLTRASGSETMTADNFTSNPSATGQLSSSGSQDIGVGATLNVAAAQTAGVYTSGNFDVTVNYN